MGPALAPWQHPPSSSPCVLFRQGTPAERELALPCQDKPCGAVREVAGRCPTRPASGMVYLSGSRPGLPAPARMGRQAMTEGLRTLLEGVIDYAGLFPPAKLPLDAALRNYARYRRQAESWMLGRFVLPAARLEELDPYVGELFAS